MPQELRRGEQRLALLALGGNLPSRLGGPRVIIQAGIEALREKFGTMAVSKLYKTPAFPPGSGDDYINAACAFHTDLEGAQILKELHEIEACFDRERNSRWSARTLDIDLIALGDTVSPNRKTFEEWKNLPLIEQTRQTPDTLILPHPRLQDRPFALVPLLDLDTEWRHPCLGQSIKELLQAHPPEAMREIQPI